MNAPPALSIGLDKNGKVVQIRVKGKVVKVKATRNHKCAPGAKTVTFKLHFCAPASEEAGNVSSPSTSKTKSKRPKGGKVSNPCCMNVGGRLLCWPPCV